MISHVHNAIATIGATKGSKAKIAALQEYEKSLGAAMTETLKAIYDPMITYGVTGKKFRAAVSAAVDSSDFEKSYSKSVRLETLPELFTLMNKMAERVLTGKAAMTALVDGALYASFECTTIEKIELIAWMLDHDARAGVGVDMINEAFPGLIETFDPMLAHGYDKKRVKNWPVGVEPKWDGFRMLTLVDTAEGTVQYLSRSGRTWDEIEHITVGLVNLGKELLELISSSESRIMIDGEIVAVGHFNDTASIVKKKGAKDPDASGFKVFDFILAHEFESRKATIKYADRRDILKRGQHVFDNHKGLTLSESYLVSSDEEAVTLYENFRNRGFEGAIVKLMESVYEFKRSYAWMKIKPKETLDLKIVDAYEGEPNTDREGKLGGVVVDFNGVHVRVGGGFNGPELITLWRDFHEGLLVGRIIEVEFHEITPAGSLRHPRFKRFRSDIDGDKY